jgi:hypothetical protein
MRPTSIRPLALAFVALAAVACGEGITDVSSSVHASRRLRADEAANVHLLRCPSPTSEFDALALVDDWGGTIAGEHAALLVPFAAVDDDVSITIESPASPYLEVSLHVAGYEHYTFDRPVTVTIDYSRCAESAIASHAALRVIYVDTETKYPLEDMGGVVDSVARTITFQTGHFSSYAVAD